MREDAGWREQETDHRNTLLQCRVYEKQEEKAKGERAILFCAVSEFGRGGVDP